MLREGNRTLARVVSRGSHVGEPPIIKTLPSFHVGNTNARAVSRGSHVGEPPIIKNTSVVPRWEHKCYNLNVSVVSRREHKCYEKGHRTLARSRSRGSHVGDPPII